MLPAHLYREAEAAGAEFCDWPNPTASGRSTKLELPPLMERRAAWNALQPPRAPERRGTAKNPMFSARPRVNANVFGAHLPQGARRRGRPPKADAVQPEILASGMPRPSSVGWRTTAGAERLLPGNVVFWRGPSLLTGEPIMAVAGQHTINAKTGPMMQIWILRADMDPIQAVKFGGDEAICGDCKLRGDHGKDRACYVQWFRAPVNIYRSKHLNWTVLGLAEAVAGKQVRVGAYGDPAAMPLAVWDIILARSAGWTGYTHQWRHEAHRGLQRLFMASVDSREEQAEAQAAGWRTFRVRHGNDGLLANEVSCPASDEMGHRTTCARCSLCRGLARPAKNVVIIAHGQPRSVNVFRRLGAGIAPIDRFPAPPVSPSPIPPPPQTLGSGNGDGPQSPP